jgi:ribonuclease D
MISLKLAHHIQEQLKQKGLYNYVLEDCSSLTKEIISERIKLRG